MNLSLRRKHLPWLAAMVIFAVSWLWMPLGNTWWVKRLGGGADVNTGAWIEPSATPDCKPKGTSIQAQVSADGFFENGIAGVSGEICVTNNGEVPTQGLTLVPQVEYKPHKGRFQPLAGASVTLVPQPDLNPGENGCYPYRIEFAPAGNSQYRLAARVTITNHSGWLPGGPHCAGPEPYPFGPEPKTEFNLAAQIGQPNIADDPAINDFPDWTPMPAVTPGPTVETPAVDASPLPEETPTEIPPVDPTAETTAQPEETATDPAPADPTAETTPQPEGTVTEPPSSDPTPEADPTQATEPPAEADPTAETTQETPQPPDPSPEVTTETPSSSETPAPIP